MFDKLEGEAQEILEKQGDKLLEKIVDVVLHNSSREDSWAEKVEVEENEDGKIANSGRFKSLQNLEEVDLAEDIDDEVDWDEDAMEADKIYWDKENKFLVHRIRMRYDIFGNTYLTWVTDEVEDKRGLLYLSYQGVIKLIGTGTRGHKIIRS